MKKLSVWLCVLLLSLNAFAVNDYYVNSATGSDSNPGTIGSPWATIQHADAALVLGTGGTNVHVAAGVGYSGPITTHTSGTAGARIVYISDVRWAAHITTVNWLASGSSYIDINGFDMTSPGTGGVCFSTQGGNNASTVASFVHFINNYCHDISTAQCFSGGAINTNGTQGPFTFQSTDNWIIGNVIRHGGSGGASCNQTHGIYADGPHDVIQNNIISGFVGWGVHRVANSTGTPFYGVISNNTITNNGGGILLTEQNNAGPQATLDYTTVSNNIIVNNGGNGQITGFGINYFHVTGTHNNVTNNLVYGNQPSDYAHHSTSCTISPISGNDAPPPGTVATNPPGGGCPSTNAKTDSSTAITFVNFQSDFNSAPNGSYDYTGMKLKVGSQGVNNATTSCAGAPGISPCVPTTDISGVGFTNDIGAWAFGSASPPAAPTNLVVTPH